MTRTAVVNAIIRNARNEFVVTISERPIAKGPRDEGIPTVAVDNFSVNAPQTPSIFIDNHEIGRTAADLFVRRGLANLATVRYTVGADALHSAQRIEGFSAAATKAGIPVSVYTPASETENQFLCHFTFPEELHHFFRRRTGLTPTEWRHLVRRA